MEILFGVYFYIIGMLLSSFYNVVGIRVPKGETLKGRSHCAKCGTTLRFIDILPLVGYLINLGKCHFCHTRIHVKYLLIEVLGGLLFLFAYVQFGFRLELIVALTMISLLIIQTVSDYEHMIVLDSVLVITGIVFITIRSIQGEFLVHLLSSAVLFSLLYGLAIYGKYRYKKDAIGGGDIKLYAVIGWILPIGTGLLSLFFASVFGLIYAIVRKQDKHLYLPMVPFIALGVLVSYFWGHMILAWYMNLLKF